jgi:hypothetical protein
MLYLPMPYISHEQNKKVRHKLQSIISTYYPQIKLTVIFRNNFCVGSFFRYADRMPNLLRSCVVYEYKCSQCPATYYGETVCHLSTRIAEHKGVSSRTGRAMTNPLHSNIRNHANERDHPIHVNNFKIISNCDKSSLKLLESILIHQVKPNLNDADTSVPLSILAYIYYTFTFSHIYQEFCFHMCFHKILCSYIFRH